MPQCWKVIENDLRLFVRVTPNASKDQIEGVNADTDGRSHLKVRVRAIPDKGKANKAVENLLAKTFGVPKSSVSIIKGSTDRLKTIHIVNGADLAETLQLDYGYSHDS